MIRTGADPPACFFHSDSDGLKRFSKKIGPAAADAPPGVGEGDLTKTRPPLPCPPL